MATLLGDFGADRFHHTMIPTSGLPYQQTPSHEGRFRSNSNSRRTPSQQPSSESPRRARSQNKYQPGEAERHRWEHSPASSQYRSQRDTAEAASPFLTPPDSSSNSAKSAPNYGSPAYMASSQSSQIGSEQSSTSSASTVIPAQNAPQSIPSPQHSDGGSSWEQGSQSIPATLEPARSQKTVAIKDLAHIQQLAQLDLVDGNGPGILTGPESPLQDMKFEISGMPIGDIIEMVAALLTKITTTNDRQHDAMGRNQTHQRQAQAQNDGSEGHSSPYSTSVLAFHGKNVPAITILSYLSRIHKYCPTTYEVFLSLLVYFDRMTERVNDIVLKDEEARRKEVAEGANAADKDTVMHEDAGGADEEDEDLADSDDEETEKPKASDQGKHAGSEAPMPTSTYFVVDSFNIHRLIIAGVTCASKFFSDVFYTNSRYAKVGGLPLAELNHLELQFLLLNDFRLAVPVEDLEAYATMLVEFYAREVVQTRSRRPAGPSSET